MVSGCFPFHSQLLRKLTWVHSLVIRWFLLLLLLYVLLTIVLILWSTFAANFISSYDSKCFVITEFLIIPIDDNNGATFLFSTTFWSSKCCCSIEPTLFIDFMGVLSTTYSATNEFTSKTIWTNYPLRNRFPGRPSTTKLAWQSSQLFSNSDIASLSSSSSSSSSSSIRCALLMQTAKIRERW